MGKAAHAVIQEAKDAGVFVFGGRLDYEDNDVEAAVVDVPIREAALEWAAKIAVACAVRKMSASSGTTRI